MARIDWVQACELAFLDNHGRLVVSVSNGGQVSFEIPVQLVFTPVHEEVH